MRWWSVLMVSALAVGACSPSSVDPSTTATEATSGPETTTTTVVSDASPCRAGGLPFASEGLIAAVGASESDASRLASIRWDPHEACERIIIAFDAESGAPATTLGSTGVNALSSAGIVRITLPEEIGRSAVADVHTDGALVDRLYVVRRESGAMFVDVVMAADAGVAVRAFTTDAPASLVLDVVSADDALPSTRPAISDTAVVVSPLGGPTLYPVTVEAYARPSLSVVGVQISAGERVAIDRTIALPASPDTWQAVTTRLDDGPSGPAVLFVGTVDADGASVALDLP